MKSGMQTISVRNNVESKKGYDESWACRRLQGRIMLNQGCDIVEHSDGGSEEYC